MADVSDANTESPAAASSSLVLSDRKLIVAVTGGISCYKTAALVSQLVQGGAMVRVLMTPGATRFITPLTFEALSGQPVVTSMWANYGQTQVQHVGLAQWADLMVIAPASANTIARIAHGLCDDIVTLTAAALPRTGPTPPPLLVAPAMNAEMWANPIHQKNIATIQETLGAKIIGPEAGWQACRTTGPGRMTSPETITEQIETRLANIS